MKKVIDFSGGALTDAPNDKYQKFFAQFVEHATTAIEAWRPIDVLAYFCAKYQAAYHVPYAFKYNTPSPTKCFEIFQIKKLAQLLSSKPAILKDYIDWIFLIKVEQAKKRFTSISFLTREEIVKEFKLKRLSSPQITRTTLLPEAILISMAYFLENAQLLGLIFEMKTYGDLAFLVQAINSDSVSKEIKDLWSYTLPKLDITILEKIK